MKIRYLSDIHTEFQDFHINPLPTDHESVLILAGDIGTINGQDRLIRFLELCNDMGFIKVLYILGNHEAYRHDINTYEATIRKLIADAKLHNVQVLENECFDYVTDKEKVRIIGTTLWTDCNKSDWFLLQSLKDRMMDFKIITNGSYQFSPLKSVDLFNKAMGYIKAVVENTGPEWKKVLACHHGVTSRSIHPAFIGDSLNGAFVSDISEHLMNWGIDVCIHGHTHYNVDYQVGECRVVSNQAGYPKEGIRKEFTDKILEV